MKNITLLFLTAFISLHAFSQVVINEINYKDAITFQTKDWIELYNNSSTAVDISNWVFKDSDDLHEFIIPNGTVMQPDSYLVLVQFLADFQVLYPDVSPVLGDFTFGLSGGGELIRLFDNTGTLVDFVEYDDIAPWPTEPDGNGPTLELINPNLDNALASSWHASVLPDGEFGTPGDLNSSSTASTNDNELDQISLSIFPNPVNDKSIIKIDSKISVSNGLLKVYNVIGREIRHENFYANEVLFEKGILNTGIYFISIYDNGVFLGNLKLFIK